MLFVEQLFGDDVQTGRLSIELYHRCLAILREGLTSTEFWPSCHAAEGLTIAGHSSEVRVHFAPKVSNEIDDRCRCGLARELVRAGDREPLRVLVDVLKKSTVRNQITAAESLFKVGEIGDEQIVRDSLIATDNQVLQLMTLAILAQQGDQQSLDRIRNKLSHESAVTRKIAAWLLMRLGQESDIGRLHQVKESERELLVRAYVDHALAVLGDEGGIQFLRDNFSSDSLEIRQMAAEAAHLVNPSVAIPQLEAALEDQELDIRIRATSALLCRDSRLRTPE